METLNIIGKGLCVVFLSTTFIVPVMYKYITGENFFSLFDRI